MKACKDQLEFISRLEKSGELVKITKEVDPRNFELSSLIRHMERGPNKAIVFQKVKDFDMPIAANLYGSFHRLALGIGIEPTQEEIEQYRGDPHGSSGALGGLVTKGFMITDKERAEIILLSKKILDADSEAARGKGTFRIIDKEKAPCKDVVVTKDIDLLKMLPIPWYDHHDAGPYITAAGSVTRDPDSRVLNIGVRRHQVTLARYGKDTMGFQACEYGDGRKIQRKYERMGKGCEVALCLGLDPATELASVYCAPNMSSPIPYSEFNIASVLMGEPLEMVKCETIDLEVPANCEIVIEGIIPPGERIEEGPMGEFTDYYGNQETNPFPFIKVTAVTHRKDPVFLGLASGYSQDHLILSAITTLGMEKMYLTRIHQHFPTVQDVAIFSGSHISHLVVSLEQSFPGEDKLLLHHLLGTTPFKYITIVDDDVEPHNSAEVEWARAMRAGKNADDFTIVPRVLTWEKNPDVNEGYWTTKLGVLATKSFGEKYERTGPPKEMLEKTREFFEKEILKK
jgi:2,5-furandicarboxylate decarboxylase 1